MDFNTIKDHSVILVSGDSTSDCGRGHPYGTYLTGLGFGYPQKLQELITAVYPEKAIKIVNAGISGETSRQVRARWQNDLEQTHPDYATLLIGVNDIWRNYDYYMDSSVAVGPQEYEENLCAILEMSSSLKGFTLFPPFYFELNHDDEFMKKILDYSAICKKVANHYQVDFLDLQPTLDNLCKTRYAITFAPDRVHPNPTAHMALARTILKHWNFQF